MQEENKAMSGRICLVTGATSGVGEATALALARQGATVIGVGRNTERCSATARRLRRLTGNSAIDFLVADLSVQGDIRVLASKVKKQYRRLDVLINNAGARFLHRLLTVDGYEMTLALNHLAPFHLTNLLLDQLISSGNGRVINVSSDAHLGCPGIDFDNLHGEKSYDGKAAYAQAKLAVLLFTYELVRRLKGRGVTVNAVDPGNVLSRFSMNNGLLSWARHVFGSLKTRGIVTAAKAARTTAYLASSGEVATVSGAFFCDCTMVRSAEASYDAEAAARLWKVSSELVKLTGLVKQDERSGG
jgi:NAD(P)-dependent dehydrogenase (short-subunit alcohol dehydrogenase family)